MATLTAVGDQESVWNVNVTLLDFIVKVASAERMEMLQLPTAKVRKRR